MAFIRVEPVPTDGFDDGVDGDTLGVTGTDEIPATNA